MADTKISGLTDGTTPASTDASPWARSGGTTVKLTWAELKAAMPGAEIGYDVAVASTPLVISSSTEASGTTIITCAAHTFDGGAVMAELFCPYIVAFGLASNESVIFCLFESTTEIGQIAVMYNAASAASGYAQALTGKLRFTPSAASHTYTVTAFKSSGTGTAELFYGSGGTSGVVPAFIRFTKV